jgi:murein DD-endopeptidase MepM/ murein hydrolase activator NlpD
MSQDSHYTVNVVAEGQTAPVRQFVVSRRRLRRLGFAAAAVLLGVAAVPALLVSLLVGHRAASVDALNRQLDQQLYSLGRRVEDAETALGRVQDYDTRVRALTRADEGVRPFGIGPLEDLEVLALREREAQATLRDDSALRTGDPEAAAAAALGQRLDALAASIDAEEVSLQEVRGYLVDREALLRAYPTIWPSDGWITSRYGFRRSPLPGAQTFHTGIDVAAAYGTPIRATADGVVISAGYRQAYGYTVEIDHGFGMGTLYAHCSRLLAEEGESVTRGDIIASLGSTGRATGPHLHYEVLRDGVPTNPSHYLIGNASGSVIE